MRKTRQLYHALLSLLSLGACGADGTLVSVNVNGRPTEVQLLQVDVRLGDLASAKPNASTEIRDGLDYFGLTLPTGASGAISIRVNGLDQSGTIIGRGCTSTMLEGSNWARLMLDMYPLPDGRDPCK